MSTRLLSPEALESANLDPSCQQFTRSGVGAFNEQTNVGGDVHLAGAPLRLVRGRLSRWSQSRRKRLFDMLCVLAALPLLVPIFLLVGLAVRCSSSGPVLFFQKRMGRHRRIFTIVKFRTLTHVGTSDSHNAVTTVGNQRFTPVGPFLRRFKLDELPQVINVFLGDMSFVGPRPKMSAHQIADMECRPGITGAATIAFAREEMLLAHVSKHKLDAYYHGVILPAKHRLDAEYMAKATFLSDLKLIVDSVLRRWDNSILEGLPNSEVYEDFLKTQRREAAIRMTASIPVQRAHDVEQSSMAEQFTGS